MAQGDEAWKIEIKQKLAVVFANNGEDLVRVLYYLDEEDKQYQNNPDRPYAPQWRSLKVTMGAPEAFQMFAQRLADDTKKAERDPQFRQTMRGIYEIALEQCSDDVAGSDFQNLDLRLAMHTGTPAAAAAGGLARAWTMTPAETQRLVMRTIRSIVSERSMTAVDDVLSLANKTTGTLVMVGLAAVNLGYKAYVNIRKWWRGEITGKRCVKNLLDATFATAAGIGGGIAGAAMGSTLGPVGTVVGGVLGGFGSSFVAERLSDLLTQKIFGIPKDEALENAYSYLHVPMTASNQEINTAFRKLALTHHPDKSGGDRERFFLLQCHMATIRRDRGEY